jgi:hypothetical protein
MHVKIYSSGTVSVSKKRYYVNQLTLNLALLDIIRDFLWATSINLATNAESGAQNLLDCTLEILGHALVLHRPGNLDNLIQRNGLGVLDVLLLLAITRRLLEGLDDKGRSGWDDGDGGLTILDGETDSDTETLPVTGGFGDIFTDLYTMSMIVLGFERKVPSLGRDPEDRSWERGRRRHRLHRQWREGE